jgi:hypothetical protein
MSLRTVRLDVFDLATAVRLDAPFMANPIAARAALDELTASVVLSFRARVAGERLKTETIRFPADWWEAVKERWFPAWAKRRWPVSYRVVTMEARGLYPLLSLPQRKDAHVEIVVHEAPGWGLA